MEEYSLNHADVSRIKSGLDKIVFYTKGQILQRRKRGKLTIGNKVVSSGNTFQLIRGVVKSVDADNDFCILDNDTVLSFEENSKASSDDPLRVCFATDDLPSEGDTIWAAYHVGIGSSGSDSGTGTGTGTGTNDIDWYKLPIVAADVKIGLIDDDITYDGTDTGTGTGVGTGTGTGDNKPDPRGIVEDDPRSVFNSDNYPLTDEEIAAGVQVNFQDPIPDDPNDLDSNIIDELDLRVYWRAPTYLKYYIEVTEDDPGYEPGKPKLRLATIAIRDSTGTGVGTGTGTGSSDRIVVRYATTPAFYDEGVPFKVGTYPRRAFPGIIETGPWPPEELPDKFLNRRFRCVIVKGVIVLIFCTPLPPPKLPDDLYP